MRERKESEGRGKRATTSATGTNDQAQGETLRALGDEALLDAARASIGSFCFEECGSRCCRRGKLNIDETDVARLFANGAARKKAQGEGTLRAEESGMFTLALDKGCPMLDALLRCGKYSVRPQICRDYPLFRFGQRVVVAPCPAAEAGKLEQFFAELRRRGIEPI